MLGGFIEPSAYIAVLSKRFCFLKRYIEHTMRTVGGSIFIAVEANLAKAENQTKILFLILSPSFQILIARPGDE